MIFELIFGLACFAIGSVLIAGTFLSPVLTFLILFTTLGNALRRALRGKPLRTAYRFDLRALMVLITFTAISLGWLKASYVREEPWGRCVVFSADSSVPDDLENHDPDVYVANWLVIALPISMLLALTRYVLDGYDDRRRPAFGPSKPSPTFDFAPPSAPGDE